MRKVAQVMALVTELRTQGLLTTARGQRTGAGGLRDRQPCNQPGTAGRRGLAGGPEKEGEDQRGQEGTGGNWRGRGGRGEGEGEDQEGSGRDLRGRERTEGDWIGRRGPEQYLGSGRTTFLLARAAGAVLLFSMAIR